MKKITPHFDREIQEQIIGILNTAKYSIRVAMYNFNDDRIFETICRKAEQGVEVEILLDSKSEQNEIILQSSHILAKTGGSVFLYYNINGNFSIMHNKFCLVDDRILLTGSYNWTNNAANHSNENIVVIEDFLVAFEYTKKFNQLKYHSTLYTENIDLPIYFSTSKNVVKRNEEVEISWRVPNADTVSFNDEIVDNIGTRTVTIDKNKKFKLSAINENYESVKIISVTIAEKPEIVIFKASEKIIRRGQSVEISWKVKGASKVKLEPFGKVKAVGTREHLPQIDTIYKLIAFDVWGEKTIKELSIRVPDFEVPSFEKIIITQPGISYSLSLEIKNPAFEKNNIKAIQAKLQQRSDNIISIEDDIIKKIVHINKINSKLELQTLKKSVNVIFKSIQHEIIEKTESVLTVLLSKLREKK